MPEQCRIFLTAGLIAAVQCWSAAGTRAADAQVVPVRGGLDREYRTKLAALADRCRQLGLPEQAEHTASWFIERDPRRLYLFLPTADQVARPPQDAPEIVHQWHRKFMQLRRDQAAKLFEMARQSLAADPSGTYRLLHEVLHEDPDHQQARSVLGFRRRGTGWQKSQAKVLRRAGRAPHPKYGWRRNDYWRVESPHFRVTTSSGPQAGVELARQLETFYELWQQVFFTYWSTPQALGARLAGGNDPWGPATKHEVVQFKSRAEYVSQLARVEPQIAVSTGYYMHGRQTSFFYAGDDALRTTWFHEATHQLFQEQGPTIQAVGEKWNFWILEGIAVYMESLVPRQGFWTVGGFDSDRLQYARARVLAGGQQTPLSELVRLGRDQVQRHPEIRRLYTQSAGLAHFLMNGAQARFRQPVVDLLRLQYQGRDTTQTLSQLTETELAALDAQYVKFLHVSEQDLRFLNPPRYVRNLTLLRGDISDAGLERVARCTRLEWLDLSFTAVTDQGVAVLNELANLQQLSLEGTLITDRALKVVGQLKQLEELDLSGTNTTDDGVRELTGLTKLKVLWLTDTDITDRALTILKSLNGLEQVHAERTGVTEQAWSRFRRELPQSDDPRP